jgi:hypothetical protein
MADTTTPSLADYIAKREAHNAELRTELSRLDWEIAEKRREITGNLEQYSLSAISVLAERAVAALVPR